MHPALRKVHFFTETPHFHFFYKKNTPTFHFLPTGLLVDSGGLRAGCGVGPVERLRHKVWSGHKAEAQTGAPACDEWRPGVWRHDAEDPVRRIQLQGRSSSARIPRTQRYATFFSGWAGFVYKSFFTEKR